MFVLENNEIQKNSIFIIDRLVKCIYIYCILCQKFNIIFLLGVIRNFGTLLPLPCVLLRVTQVFEAIIFCVIPTVCII